MQKLIWKFKIWAGKSQRIILRYLFGFDKWHVYTLTEKKYARDIIDYCNARAIRNRFAEIGCGLGDIVRRVHYTEREGYDSDAKSLAAARFLSRLTSDGRIIFSEFEFPSSPLPGTYDVIVLVNWIHHIDPNILKAGLAGFFKNALNDQGVIIIDTVQDPEYKYNHRIQFLSADLQASTEKLGDYERQREIWAIKK